MEVIKFFFEDFWHWLGGIVFLVIIVDGIFVNLFRLINNIVEYRHKTVTRDPMELPTEAPEGALWPWRDKKYFRKNGVWIQLTDNDT